MALRFLKRAFFVASTDTKSNAINTSAACSNKTTASMVLAEWYGACKATLTKEKAIITHSYSTRDQYYIRLEDGTTYCGQVVLLDLQHPLNLRKTLEGDSVNGG